MLGLSYKKVKIGLVILSIPVFIKILHELSDTYYFSLPELKDNLENKIKEQEQEDEEQNINLWSELDVNLLGEILSRLCLTDQARFRAVCKNWLAAHPLNTIKPLPWYLSFDFSLTPVTRRFEFQVLDPSSRNQVSLYTISLTKFGIPCSSDLNIAAYVKNNWLLIGTRERRLFFWNRRCILLFSPFTRKIITLPKFDYPCRFKFKSTFSTQPDSPDCVFFLLDTSNADKIALLTYQSGDKEWTAKQFDTVGSFLPCSCRLIYLRGMLYIVSPCGQLASYNIVNGAFKFESLIVDYLFLLNFRSSRSLKVFELNGELMILYLGFHAKENVNSPIGKHCIKRYNWSHKVWIPVSTLGDKTLFVSDQNIEVATINKMETRSNGVLSNKIYHFNDDGCLIYSIEDGELVEFKSVTSNLLEDDGGDLAEYKNNYGITFSDTKKSIYWLEPPSVRF